MLFTNPITTILIKARDIISDAQDWCVECQGMNVHGELVEPLSKEAIKFCALGAVARAKNDPTKRWMEPNAPEVEPLAKALNILDPKFVKKNSTLIAHYNNTHTHSEVLALFDKAIEISLVEAA